LQQEVLTAHHEISAILQSMSFAQQQFVEAEKRLTAANEWVNGARLRYQNPSPDQGGANWLLENLNDYLDSIQFKTDAATERAELLANYNTVLVQLEQAKGTLLQFFAVNYVNDPCFQAARLGPPPTHPDDVPGVKKDSESYQDDESTENKAGEDVEKIEAINEPEAESADDKLKSGPANDGRGISANTRRRYRLNSQPAAISAPVSPMIEIGDKTLLKRAGNADPHHPRYPLYGDSNSSPASSDR
jgi:hypothetical protein